MPVKLKSINDMKPADYNPRIIKKREFEGLKNSMGEFGDISGIVWNEKTGNIVSGHQRVQALRAAGVKKIEEDARGYFMIDPVTDERFSVRVVNWDIRKEKLANISANNPKIQGEWSDEIGSFLDELSDDDQFENLGLDSLSKELGIEETDPKEEPEVEFTEELLEEHNYVVLYFDNKVDWLQAETILGLKKVKALHSKDSFQCAGIGRVLNGPDAIKKIQEAG